MKLRSAGAAFVLVFAISSLAIAQSKPLIAMIEIDGNHQVSQSLVRAQISSRTGQPLNREAVAHDLKVIYAIGKFERVTASIQGNTLVYTVLEKPKLRHCLT